MGLFTGWFTLTIITFSLSLLLIWYKGVYMRFLCLIILLLTNIIMGVDWAISGDVSMCVTWSKIVQGLKYGWWKNIKCIAKDGGIFGTDMMTLRKYNDKGELLELRIYGVEEELFYCVNLQSARYRESLLSLPTLIRNPTKDDHQQLIRRMRVCIVLRSLSPLYSYSSCS